MKVTYHSTRSGRDITREGEIVEKKVDPRRVVLERFNGKFVVVNFDDEIVSTRIRPDAREVRVGPLKSIGGETDMYCANCDTVDAGTYRLTRRGDLQIEHSCTFTTEVAF